MNDLAIELPMEELAAFCKRHKITRLWVFGSVLTERFDDESDIDLIAEFSDASTFTLRATNGREEELRDLFHRPIDLVSYDSVLNHRNSIRRESVLSDARLIYGS